MTVGSRNRWFVETQQPISLPPYICNFVSNKRRRRVQAIPLEGT